MAYQINKTDGTVLATVADGQLDRDSTDLILIGKNFSGFGESLNENFVKLLENFANNSRPVNPVRGQIWFDTSDLKLKVYTGSEFVPVGSATISRQQPTDLNTGDFWYDELNQQLFFFNGSSLVLLAPSFTQGQGLSGIKVETITDILNQPRVVVYFYVAGTLIGIFSKESFTPQNPISGFSGSIVTGFNPGNLQGFKINAVSADSEKLGGIDASSYLKNIQDTETKFLGPVSVAVNQGLSIGINNQATLAISSLESFDISVKNLSISETALSIVPSSREFKIYPNQISSQTTVGGSVTVKGDLTVEGTTTTISTQQQNIIIANKTITLAQPSTGSPSDQNANGGGIILKGTTDHTLIWDNSTTSWNSSEHINLAENKYFSINGVPVLTENSLGLSITSIPGVTNFGVQNKVEIGPGIPPSAIMRLENNRISTIGTLDLEVEVSTGRSISLINNPRITGMANPINGQDAATKSYVDDYTKLRNLIFSIDLSDNKSDSYIINNILNQIAPVEEFLEGTVARILCSISENNPVNLNINPSIVRTTDSFNRPSGTALALTNISIDPVVIQGSTIKITRIIKVFRIVNGFWSLQTNITLPA